MITDGLICQKWAFCWSLKCSKSYCCTFLQGFPLYVSKIALNNFQQIRTKHYFSFLLYSSKNFGKKLQLCHNCHIEFYSTSAYLPISKKIIKRVALPLWTRNGRLSLPCPRFFIFFHYLCYCNSVTCLLTYFSLTFVCKCRMGKGDWFGKM